jgi:hypothetical protein
MRVLVSMFVLALLMATLSLTATMTAEAKGKPPDPRYIPLGCICEGGPPVWDCCSDAIWHPEQGGWIECRGYWFYEWYIPAGCDPY